MAFKMKGSPMARNFGIGASPMKDATEPKKIESLTPDELAAHKERKKKLKTYHEMRSDEFKKDDEGVLRDSEGKSVSERYNVDKSQSERDRKSAGQ